MITADISRRRCLLKFTLGEQSCFGLGSCTNWARHIRNVRIKRKRRVVRRTSTYLKASCLNVFWAYWFILWLWKNPTLMQFQARHACCSYPEWLPLENNSTNCSMHAMITSVLSNRNHPSFITLLGPEVFNLPGLWFKVQTIRKAKLQQNHCHFLAQCFANRSYRYARRSQPSWASYAKLPSTCSQSQKNLLSTAVFHLKNFLSKQHQTTFGFAVTSMTSMTSLGLVIKPPFLSISIHVHHVVAVKLVQLCACVQHGQVATVKIDKKQTSAILSWAISFLPKLCGPVRVWKTRMQKWTMWNLSAHWDIVRHAWKESYESSKWAGL